MTGSVQIWNYRSWKFAWRRGKWRGFCTACHKIFVTGRKEDMLEHIDTHCNTYHACNKKKATG